MWRPGKSHLHSRLHYFKYLAFSNFSVCSGHLVCILLVSVTSSGKQPPGTTREREADGVPGMVVCNGSHTEHVWHYDEEFRSGGGTPKPASPGSPEQGDGGANSGFVALNLSSGLQDVELHDWVMVEKGSDLQDFKEGAGSSPGHEAKLTSSPSDECEEEPEVLQPMDESPDKGSTPSPLQGDTQMLMAQGPQRMDRLELCVFPAAGGPPVTPTSPGEALAEGALTQVTMAQKAHCFCCLYKLSIVQNLVM